MTQQSRFWNGTTTGDAAGVAPYDASTEFARVLMSLSGANALADKGGVYPTVANDILDISSPSANTQRIGPGTAEVYGTWYLNDSNVDVSIPTPATSTRNDRIVLRKDWTTQTVRLTRLAGTEGAGAPVLTQTAGVTWDTPLYQVSITTGGVMTVTDQREFMHSLIGFGVRATSRGTIAFGTTPKLDWGGGISSLQLGLSSTIWAQNASRQLYINNNTYFSDSNRALSAGAGVRLRMVDDLFAVGVAGSASAGAVHTFAEKLMLNASEAGLNGILGNYAWLSGQAPLFFGNQYALLFGSSAQGMTLGYNTYMATDQSFRVGNTSTAPSRVTATSGAILFRTTTANAGQTAGNPWAVEVGFDYNGPSRTLQPFIDNGDALGNGSKRWTAVHAVNGTIQTSISSAKTITDQIDQQRAWDVLRSTKFFQFTYKPGPYATNHDDPIWHRKHWGFAAEDNKWASPDGESTSPLSVASYVAAALQGYAAVTDARIAELEAQIARLTKQRTTRKAS